MSIADALLNRIDSTQNPSVVGLDPRLSSLPEAVRREAISLYGNSREGAAFAIERFCRIVVDQVADIVPAVKPQVAFFEQYGAEGFRAFERTIAYAKSKGLIVIDDSKRGDIGTTAEAYAAGHIGEVELFEGKTPILGADWITVNLFLGDDGIKPFLGSVDRGIFVLVKTSNPTSGQFQNLTTEGTPLYLKVAEAVNSLAGSRRGTRGYSSVGAVVGATYPKEAEQARKAMPHSIILVPGYGKQGGTAESLSPFFNPDGYGAIVNSSRGIIFAYEENKPSDAEKWPTKIREAAIRMRDEIVAALRTASKLPKGW